MYRQRVVKEGLIENIVFVYLIAILALWEVVKKQHAQWQSTGTQQYSIKQQ